MNQQPTDIISTLNHNYYLEFGEFFYRVMDNKEFLNLGFHNSEKNINHPTEAQKQLVLEVVKSGDFKPNQSILDVGCGLGGPARLVASTFQTKVTGIDVYTHHIEQATENAITDQVEIKFGSSLDMPFSNDTFDGAYSIESAFHYENKKRFLSESYRVLKQGGKLVVADILKNHNAKNKWVTRAIQGGIGSPNLYDVDLYRRTASEVGLELIQVRDISKQVRNTLPMWIKFCKKKSNKLYQHYGLKTYPMMVGFIIEFYLICSHPSFSYQIMVFKKP